MTTDLIRRIWEHKHGFVDGFSKKYNLHLLVWFEHTDTIEEAASRELQMKKWKRDWKTELIEKSNPEWDDLYPVISQ